MVGRERFRMFTGQCPAGLWAAYLFLDRFRHVFVLSSSLLSCQGRSLHAVPSVFAGAIYSITWQYWTYLQEIFKDSSVTQLLTACSNENCLGWKLGPLMPWTVAS